MRPAVALVAVAPVVAWAEPLTAEELREMLALPKVIVDTARGLAAAMLGYAKRVVAA